MCRMTNAVSWDSFQNLCLAIKTMFSIWQVVCVFFAVYEKYTCSFPNERWYELWLKIEVMCFSNTLFTCKIIFDISKQAKFAVVNENVCCLNSFPTVAIRNGSCSYLWMRDKNRRYIRFLPNLDSGMISSLANYRPIFRSFRHIPPRENFVKLAH